VHDPCAVFYVIDRTQFETIDMSVEIELGSALGVGRTVCDLYNMKKRPKNVTVCMKMNVKMFWEKMLEAIEKANTASKHGITSSLKVKEESAVEDIKSS